MNEQTNKYPELVRELEKAQLFTGLTISNVYTNEGFKQRLMEIVGKWHESKMAELENKYASAIESNTDRAEVPQDKTSKKK